MLKHEKPTDTRSAIARIPLTSGHFAQGWLGTAVNILNSWNASQQAEGKPQIPFEVWCGHDRSGEQLILFAEIDDNHSLRVNPKLFMQQTGSLLDVLTKSKLPIKGAVRIKYGENNALWRTELVPA